MEQVADSSFQGMQSNGRAINDSPYCNVHPRDRITRQINDPLKFCLTGPNQDTKKDDAHQQPCSVSNQATSYCSPRQMDSASTKCHLLPQNIICFHKISSGRREIGHREGIWMDSSPFPGGDVHVGTQMLLTPSYLWRSVIAGKPLWQLVPVRSSHSCPFS